jgi:alanyl aminopeptidase
VSYTQRVRLTLWLAVIVAACGPRELPSAPLATRPSDARVVDAPASTQPTAPGLRLPATATPLAYDLRLEVDPERDVFRGRVEIRVRLQQPSEHIWLHAVELEIAAASFRTATGSGALSNLEIANDQGMQAFGFGAKLPAGEVTLAFEYAGKTGLEEAEGLFRQQAGGRWFLYSQAEAMFARRIVPCFDEPSWKPTWRVTLVVPGKHAALGNGAVVSDTRLADGRREVALAEVGPMPSYLLAIAAGPFTLIDAGRVGRSKLPVRVAVAPGDARQAGVVAAKLPVVVEALERYLDRPLPLAKLDLVAVPRFFGAMENVGLITFQSSILVGDARSSSTQRRFIRFAAHELAHQWFGNSATPAWWDDLWLSEGISTWLGEKVSDELGSYDDPALRAALARLHALEADDAFDPRPLRRGMAITDDVDDWFDAISYEKGAAVLEMLERFAGKDVFRDAIRAYLRAHADRSVTTDDFLRVLPGGSAALRWYLTQPGTPVVEVKLECNAGGGAATRGGAISLRARQGTVPVCIRHAGSEARTCRLVAAKPERIAVDVCPKWVIGNADGVGYYRVASPNVPAEVLTPTERLAVADDLGAAVLRGELAIGDALRELRGYASGDVLSQLAALELAETIDPIIDDASRPAWSNWLAARFAKRLAKLLAFKTPLDRELRDRLAALVGADRFDPATAIAARALVERALARGHSPPEFALAIAAPRAGKPLFERIVALAAAAPDRRQEAILASLGAFGPELAPRVVELFTGERFKPARVWPALQQMLARPATRTAAWNALRDRSPQLLAIAKVPLDEIVEAAGSLCDRAAADELVKAFAGHGDAHVRAGAVASIDRCIARRARLGDLASALRKP